MGLSGASIARFDRGQCVCNRRRPVPKMKRRISDRPLCRRRTPSIVGSYALSNPHRLRMPQSSMSTTDNILHSEWLPVANADEVPRGSLKAVRLAGMNLVLWRGADDAPHAWRDQCPHRGTKLSLGRVERNTLVCGYHGWAFNDSGRCVRMPSHPTLSPPGSACAVEYAVREKYGVIWVCLGVPARELDVFPEYERPDVRRIHLAPQVVHSSAPRLVENFLDMAHFPFVHAGTLGEEPHTEVRDYTVKSTPEGIVATRCLFWQPSAMPNVSTGSDVEYVYCVRRPLLAVLNKLPNAKNDVSAGAMHILLAISPLDECNVRAWLVTVFENDTTSSDQALYDFNHGIFMQDVPIVESQEPKYLPLEANAELHQRCDRLAVSYRRWLKDGGWVYGTSLGSAAKAGQGL